MEQVRAEARLFLTIFLGYCMSAQGHLRFSQRMPKARFPWGRSHTGIWTAPCCVVRMLCWVAACFVVCVVVCADVLRCCRHCAALLSAVLL